MKPRFQLFPQASIALVLLSSSIVRAQDWVHTGTNLGQDRIRLAAAEFKPLSTDPQTPSLKAVFDATPLRRPLCRRHLRHRLSFARPPNPTPAPQLKSNFRNGLEGAGQRRHGRLRIALRFRRPSHCSGLALRCPQHRQPARSWASNIPTLPRKTGRASPLIALPTRSSSASAAASMASPRTRIYFIKHPHRHQRYALVHGLRRPKTSTR